MKRFASIVLSTVVAFGFGAAAIAQDDPIAARKAVMQSNAASVAAVAPMLEAGGTFDATAAAAAMQTLVENAEKIPGLFPPGSTAANSRALPAIWENFATFEGNAAKLGTDAAAAATAAAEG